MPGSPVRPSLVPAQAGEAQPVPPVRVGHVGQAKSIAPEARKARREGDDMKRCPCRCGCDVPTRSTVACSWCRGGNHRDPPAVRDEQRLADVVAAELRQIFR